MAEKDKNLIIILLVAIILFLVLIVFSFRAMIIKGDVGDVFDKYLGNNGENCDGPFNVGYKLIENANYVSSNGELKTKVISMWYPTNENGSLFDYPNINIYGNVDYNAVPDSECGPYPLVIFSHGYGGCGIQSIFFTEELASRGYIVIATDHDDSICSSETGGEGNIEDFDLSIFGNPESWSESSFYDRREDINFLIEEAGKMNDDETSGFNDLIDLEKIGMSGHSLGGYTTLGYVGGWPGWKDDRIKAAVLFAPVIQPYLLNGNISNVDIPIMMQGGTDDMSELTSYLDDVYNQLEKPKFFLMFDYAGHLAWANFICRDYSSAQECLEREPVPRLIDFYSFAFFDKYLKNKNTDEDLKQTSDILDAQAYEF